eukprot:g2012.t1
MQSVSFSPFRVSPSCRRIIVRSSIRTPVRRLSRSWSECTSRPMIVHATAPDPEQMKKMQETMNAAMKNPQMRERMNQMQEALKNPQVRQQLEETMAYMQNEDTQKRIQEMREDPEFKEKFEEIRKGGIGAMMKAMNDVEFLEKVGKRVGAPPGVTMSPQSPPTAPSEAEDASVISTEEDSALPEITTLLDAAKYGDLEAVEDFLAIGKDPNLVDEFDRTPLHFAVSIQHLEIIEVLISSNANLEAKDSKKNTPLHYAAGYGRVEALRRLLAAGADGSVKNENGKTPADVARLSEKNPILQEEDLIGKLDELARST